MLENKVIYIFAIRESKFIMIINDKVIDLPALTSI